MKKITNYILICTCALGFSSCVNTFLDLEPLDAKTDVIYFKTPEHFREYANGLYGQFIGMAVFLWKYIRSHGCGIRSFYLFQIFVWCGNRCDGSS